MRYWDTSSLIPLMIREGTSARMRQLIDEDLNVVTSALTSVEVASASWRRRHDGKLSAAAHQLADALFADLSQTWLEIPVSIDVIHNAISLLSRHRLRAADAVQLGSYMTAAGTTRGLPFVTLDGALAVAARAEGFTVLP